MPTKKIGEIENNHPGWSRKKTEKTCFHPEHNPPSKWVWVFEPGVYEHTCPNCGEVKVFIIQKPEL